MNPPDSPPEWAEFAAEANEVLWVLLGRQFPGVCTVTVRPRRRTSGCGVESLLGVVHGGCVEDAIPMSSVYKDDDHPIEVKIDGEVFTNYYLRNGHELVRSDGGYWPSTNKLHLADTAAGTWSISYSLGAPPPRLVQRAAHELAADYIRASLADPRTKLPPTTTSHSRQGQSYSVQAEAERVRSAGSALPLVAQAHATYNPTNTRTRPFCWSPDYEWDLEIVG